MKIIHRTATTLISKLLLTIFAILPFTVGAQTNDGVVETLKQDGKIYVVVLVICTIFAGIIAFLVYLDRKISRLEKNNKK